MFLVTVRQHVEGRDPALMPSKKFHRATVKDLGDWCHAFIRACANAGWLREPVDLMAGTFLAPHQVRMDLRQQNLAPRITLRRTGQHQHKDIVIEIENLDASTPAQAAASFTC